MGSGNFVRPHFFNIYGLLVPYNIPAALSLQMSSDILYTSNSRNPIDVTHTNFRVYSNFFDKS